MILYIIMNDIIDDIDDTNYVNDNNYIDDMNYIDDTNYIVILIIIISFNTYSL